MSFSFTNTVACGDGALDPGEECDDGNTLSCDGCSETCLIERGGRLDTDLLFDEPLTTIRLEGGSMASGSVSVMNGGMLPVRVTGIEFEGDWFPPSVHFSPIAVPFSLCPGVAVVMPFEVDAAGAANGLYSGFLRLAGDPGLGVADHRIDVRVVPPGLPDLTPISPTGVTIIPSPAGASEDFSISATVSNMGSGDSGPFTVNFLDGFDLLGSVDVPGGLAVDQAIGVAFDVGGGSLIEGFHVIRVEVMPPPEGEFDDGNNVATTVHQVGTLGALADAAIIVSAGSTAQAACGGASVLVNGRADYLVVSNDSSLLTFPVQGGRTTVSLWDGTGTTLIATSPATHTLTTGTFAQVLGAPAPGDYIVRIEVTDFMLTGVRDLPLTIAPAGECHIDCDGPGCQDVPPPVVVTPEPPDFDFSLCDEPLTLLDATCTTPLQGNAPAGVPVCVRATVHYTGPWPVWDQPVHFLAHVQQGDGLVSDLFATKWVNFIGSDNGGSGVVQLFAVWDAPPDGEHAIEVRVDPTVSEDTSNNLATILVRAGTGVPTTSIEVTAFTGGGFGPLWVFGQAHYAGSDLPVGCGSIVIELFDAANPSTPIDIFAGGTDAFGFYIGGLFGTYSPGEYIVRVTVSDGTGSSSTQTPVSLPPVRPAPLTQEPPPPQPYGWQDLYLFAENLAFVGSCDPLTGLFAWPEPGETLGVYATIHYVGPTPLLGQPVEVSEFVPDGPSWLQIPIGSTTVDFPQGNGQDAVCLPWTPLTGGTRIVQVKVTPTVEQFLLNDAATRAFGVGRELCDLQLSATTIHPRSGFPAVVEVSGSDASDLTNIMDLTVLPMPLETIPPGMTTSFDPPPPLTVPFTTNLTVGIDDSTPEGWYSLIVVGSSDICTAFDVFTVQVLRDDQCNAAPLTQGYYYRQCLGAGLIIPGRNGRGPTTVLEPDFLKVLVPRVDQILQDSVYEFGGTCSGMDANPPSDPCQRALKQYTALLLNIESGRVQNSCEIDLGFEGCASPDIGNLVNELTGLINTATSDSCKLAAACAGAINEGEGLWP